MSKYKINIIYSKDSNINDIVLKVINKELKKSTKNIRKDDEKEVTSNCTYLSLKSKGGTV